MFIMKSSKKDTLDVRYLRENAKKIIGIKSLDEGNIYVQVDKEHDLNDELGKHLRLYIKICIALEKFYDGIIEW